MADTECDGGRPDLTWREQERRTADGWDCTNSELRPGADSGHRPFGSLWIEVARTNGWQAFGIVLTSSTAGIRIVPAGGRLRAGHSRWLMAIPAAWDGFACTAMQSMSKSPRRSSKRTSKAKEKPNEPIA